MDKRKGRWMMLRCWPIFGRRVITVLFTLALLLPIGPTITKEAAASTVADSVKYREWPEGGSYLDNGRTLNAEEHARYGIDINSHVDLEVDSASLKRKLADKAPGGLSPEAQKLQARILLLQEMSHQVNSAMKNLQKAFADFNSAKENPRLWDQANKSISEFSGQMKSITDPLKKAIGLRLQAEGTVTTEKERKTQTDAMINSIYINDGTYDWRVLLQLYEAELAALDKALSNMVPQLDKLQMEIQGHIFRAGNPQGEPISLSRYNTVKECIPTPLPKVTFNVPSDQLKLYEENLKTVQNMTDAKSVAEAMRMQLAIEAQRLRALLEQSFASAAAAVKQSRQSVEALGFWEDQDKAEGWLTEARKKAGTSEDGKRIIAAYLKLQVSLVALYQDARFDLDVMARYAEMRSAIENQTPEQAMMTILNKISEFAQAQRAGKVYLLMPAALQPATWRARKADVEQLIKAVKESAPEIAKKLEADVNFEGRNPIQDAQAAAEAFNNAVVEVSKVSQDIPVWLAQVLQLPPALAVGELPRPEGQERLSIVKDDLGTSFDLQTICGPRSEYDQIRITYKYYKGDVELDAGWHNDFQLRKYGWKDSVVAGISFTRQRSTNTYKPTASLSWILDHTSWPGTKKDGTVEKGVGGKNDIELFSGFGLTTMSLDFDPQQDAELGLGFTLSFLNNKILVGYGTDLQASDHTGFWFFSINLFQTTGMFPGTAKQTQ
jgi:hypothetical protein